MYTSIRSPLDLCCSRINNPSSSNLPLQLIPSNPRSILINLFSSSPKTDFGQLRYGSWNSCQWNSFPWACSHLPCSAENSHSPAYLSTAWKVMLYFKKYLFLRCILLSIKQVPWRNVQLFAVHILLDSENFHSICSISLHQLWTENHHNEVLISHYLFLWPLVVSVETDPCTNISFGLNDSGNLSRSWKFKFYCP